MRLPVLVFVLSLFACGATAAPEIHGFLDVRAGARLDVQDAVDRESVAEARLQLDWVSDYDDFTLRVRPDLVLDGAADAFDIDLDTGDGAIDLREALIQVYPPFVMLEAKLGRQILTWGTGDLLFINDLFPKDWRSFLVGRDDEYLKAPSDAIKLSGFFDLANVDVVYTPRFDADRYVRGERVRYWNRALERIAGEDAIIEADVPHGHEWAGRLYRNLNGLELAAYAYDGYWKSPAGMDPVSGAARFPALRVWGASARGQWGGGIAHAEYGYYDSREDAAGNDPLIRNSETRVLLGYEREVARSTTLGVQAYAEIMSDYSDYLATLPADALARDQERSVLTLRLTQLARQQTLRLSLVALYSPSDEDVHLRPKAHLQLSDQLSMELGAVLSYGEEPSTFYAQFEENNAIHAALRSSF